MSCNSNYHSDPYIIYLLGGYDGDYFSDFFYYLKKIGAFKKERRCSIFHGAAPKIMFTFPRRGLRWSAG